MRQLYIRKSQHTVIGDIPAASCRVSGHIYANRSIYTGLLLQNAKSVSPSEKLF